MELKPLIIYIVHFHISCGIFLKGLCDHSVLHWSYALKLPVLHQHGHGDQNGLVKEVSTWLLLVLLMSTIGNILY